MSGCFHKLNTEEDVCLLIYKNFHMIHIFVVTALTQLISLDKISHFILLSDYNIIPGESSQNLFDELPL